MASTYTLPDGLSLNQKKAMAAMLACAPCCSGSGSGSSGSGGASVPCGCSACDCCVGICWWKTTWHKSWTTGSGKYATGAVSPEWVMTSYSMSLASWVATTDYVWGGEALFASGSCALAFASKLESNCTLSVLPAILTGTVSYVRTIAPFDTVTFTVSLYPTITVQFGCSDDYVFCLYTGFSSSGGFTGHAIPGSTGNGLLDYEVAHDSGTDQVGVDTTSCSFTATSPGNINIPSITIIPVA